MLDLKNFIMNQSDPDMVNFINMTTSLSEQCAKEEITLADLVGEGSYSFKIPNSMAVFFNEYIDLSVDVKSKINLTLLQEKVGEDPEPNKFWQNMIDYWESVDERHLSLAFMRSGDSETQKNIIAAVFDKFILQQNQPQNIGDIKFDQITKVINMLNYAKKHVLMYSQPRDAFVKSLGRYYSLEKSIAGYIWDLLSQSRPDIIQREMLERLEIISDTQDNLNDLIAQLMKRIDKITDLLDKSIINELDKD